MSNDYLQNMVRGPRSTITRFGLNVRTKGRTCHMSIKRVPCEARVVYHMFV